MQIDSDDDDITDPSVERPPTLNTERVSALTCLCGSDITEENFEHVAWKLTQKTRVSAECSGCKKAITAIVTDYGISVEYQSASGVYYTLGHIGNRYDTQNRDCQICMAKLSEADGDILSCMPCQSHAACHHCMVQHLESTLNQGSLPECFGYDCNILWTEPELQLISNTESLINKFHRLSINQACAQDPTIFSCQTPDCTYIAVRPQLQPGKTEQVHCPVCNKAMTFFKPKGEQPARLAAKEQSQEYINYDYIKSMIESGQWKLCPECKSPIEKIDGCQHIKCSRCRFHFCWVCQGDWGDSIRGYRTHTHCNMSNGGTTRRQVRRVQIPAFHFISSETSAAKKNQK